MFSGKAADPDDVQGEFHLHRIAPVLRIQAARSGECASRQAGGDAVYGEERMKSTRASQGNVDVSNLSIPEAEEIIEEALSELSFSQDPGMARAHRFLAPPGFQAIVELCGENGRSKRRNASADAWSPDEDEVRIYFERIDDGEAAPRTVRGAPRAGADHNFE